MASGTWHRSSRIARHAALVLAGALLLRRLTEISQTRRCARWSAERLSSVAPSHAGDQRDHLICIVPMYHEQQIVADAVACWTSLVQAGGVDEVLFVTTAKEEDDGQRSTRALLASALAQPASAEPRLRLTHCATVDRFRAAQLNLAVTEARERCGSEQGSSRSWIGVYNADSRPLASTFAELQQRARAERDTRAFQQLADYVIPGREGVSWLAAGNSVLQTWWTRSHYWARNTRGSGSPHWWSATSPFSTFGHGEFIRLDLLDEIGGFPDFAYADGLLLGWACRLMDERIGLLASRDRAEVPRTARDIITQQRAWMRGLLNFGATVRWARDRGALSLAAPQVALLRCQHLAIPLAWGLSTPAVVAGIALAVERLARGKGTLTDAAILLGLASYPVIPALATGRERDGGTSPLIRPMAAAASWTIEGIAYWPAVVSHLLKSQAAPAKTPR
jgi:hypothetical protein